ncbi:AraC family transcriptional regulator [Jiangella asiatica]|uniref:AraC family transcriptional regulator n=1 Tax=Jiangella asiatica TaxID=2530372 RepID=A0A4R5DAG4_9ACTN|nr:AraC family transcriptional regulator [Jiangella asiatica]TDE10616.1 AraC family transcriptional regulator [Jiangella asiatica]
MTTPPLQRYELFHTKDLDHARELVGQVFVPHRLDLVGGSTRFDARMHTKRLGRVAANYVTYGGAVLIEPGELGSFFVVQVPLAGHSMINYGGEMVVSTPEVATVISPTVPLSMRWSEDCAKLILRLERPAVEAHLRDLIGAPLPEPVRFEAGMDISTGFGRSWVGYFRTLVEELDRTDGSMINNRLAAAEFEDWLMTTLLLAQPHNYSHLLDESEQSSVPNRAVTLVRELIENHPEWEHTVRSLAGAAGVSVRAVQLGFRQHLGTTPREYLTSIRMQRAHDELRAAQRDTTTVSRVVAKWGLGHPGRFAAVYRKRYGELPSRTLDR